MHNYIFPCIEGAVLSSSLSMTAGKKNKWQYNFFSLGVVQAISSLLQLVVIPHVISKVGVDGYGVIAVAQVVMFYLAVVTDYGFNQTATRDIALYRSDTSKISRLFFRVFFTRLVLCGIAFILLLALLIAVPVLRAHFFLYLMAFVFVLGQSIQVNWFFQGLERMQFSAFATLLARVIFAVFVFVFIRDKTDNYLFLFFLGAGSLIAGIISIIVAFRIYRLRFSTPTGNEIRGELKEGWQITVSHLSHSTCQYANIFILRMLTNDLVAGYYGIAERILFMIKQVMVVFSQAVYPNVCRLVQNGKKHAFLFFRKVYFPFLFLVVAGCALLCIFSSQVLYFFMGDEYIHSVFYLRVLCIVAVIVCLNIPATLVLLSMNQQKSYFRVYAIATILNITLNVILAYYFAATGTVMTVFVTELFIMLGLTREMYREDVVKQKIGGSSTAETVF